MVFFHIRQATHPPPNLPLEGGGEEKIPGLEKIFMSKKERTQLSSAALGGA
jgi:hypothetical protein